MMAAHLAQEYQRLGHDVSILTTTPDRAIQGVEDWKGLRVHRIYAPSYHERWRAYLSLYNPWVSQPARLVLSREKPDVLHAHNVHYHLSYHFLKIAANLGVSVAITFHDVMSVDYGKFTQGIPLEDHSDFPRLDYRVRPWRTIRTYRTRYFPLRNALIRWYLHRFTRARVAVSQELRHLLGTNGVRCTHVVHNGLDPQTWEIEVERVQSLRHRLGLHARKVVLFGGRLGFWKGGEQIVRSLPLIASAVPETVILVLGRIGSYAQHMRRAGNALGVGDKLIFAGWLDGTELAAAYALANVVVVPSVCFDSFPTAVLEAMAAKTPVVATCFGGAKEAVVNGETGYIVNPLSVETLAQRIVMLLQGEQQGQQMGKAGHQRLMERFTLERCAERYLKLFETL